MLNLNPLVGCDRYCLTHEVAWNSKGAGEKCFIVPSVEEITETAGAIEIVQQPPQNDSHRVIALGQFMLGTM